MGKIGLFGGTFDPPHIGHLLVAQEVLCQCNLDEIWFIPSAIPPHKSNRNITKNEIRIEMVNKAIADNAQFKVSLIEFERSGPSYTIDTVRNIKAKYKNHDFSFIIGGDMINDLPNWYQIEELLNEIQFIGIQRPGVEIQTPFTNHVTQIIAPQFEVSSSDIRERVAMGNNTKYLLPEEVRKYIEENNVYG